MRKHGHLQGLDGAEPVSDKLRHAERLTGGDARGELALAEEVTYGPCDLDDELRVLHELCRAYDTLCIEDLQLTGMTRLWGRKMFDLAFGSFVQKLEHTASKYGCKVVKIDRYYPSSKTCNVCQYVNELLSLSDRSWTCPSCGTSHDREVNAAKNILRQGIVSSGSTLKTRLAEQGASATGESSSL